MYLIRCTVGIVIALALAGCIEGTSYVTKNKSSKVDKYVLEKKPEKIGYPLDANFEGKVVLLGYDLSAETSEPGDRVEVTWYWECKEATGPGWRIFTHALDAKGKSKANRDKVGIVRKHFQPEHWKPGMVIKDVQKIRIPKEWSSDALELRIGLWKGSKRMAGKGKSVDLRNRVQGPRVKIRQKQEKTARIPRAAAAPELDGAFETEAAWKDAVALKPFRHTMTGKKVGGSTDVRLMWDDKFLYVAMKATDDHLKSPYKEHDDELWKADAFELFLDPKGDKKDYYELQVNPAGIVFDSHLPTHRKNRNEWTSQMRVAVATDGALNDAAPDKGWSAELAVPFAAMDAGGGIPPAAGDKWKINFFRVDATAEKTRYSAWSPPMRGDFHALDKFGEVVFAGPRKAEKAPAPAAEKAPAPADAEK